VDAVSVFLKIERWVYATIRADDRQMSDQQMTGVGPSPEQPLLLSRW
jgi:hypothetical protein